MVINALMTSVRGPPRWYIIEMAFLSGLDLVAGFLRRFAKTLINGVRQIDMDSKVFFFHFVSVNGAKE